MGWEIQSSSRVLPLPQPSASPVFLVLVGVDMENQVLHSGEVREDMKAVRFKNLTFSFCIVSDLDLASVHQQVLLLGRSLG